MPYCETADVKKVLHIAAGELAEDEEIADCITSGDGLINELVKGKGLTVPALVPQSVKDASKHLAAHIYRIRRLPPDSPLGSPILYDLGMAFLNAWFATFQVGKIV
jgi:hypothetical protein